MYLIIRKFNGGVPVQINQFVSRHNAYQYCEDVAYKALESLIGDKPKQIYKCKTISGYWKTYNNGYFIVNAEIGKYIIYRKTTISGYIRNYSEVEKICTYSVAIRPYKKKYKFVRAVFEDDRWDDVMDQLLDNINVIDGEDKKDE